MRWISEGMYREVKRPLPPKQRWQQRDLCLIVRTTYQYYLGGRGSMYLSVLVVLFALSMFAFILEPSICLGWSTCFVLR